MYVAFVKGTKFTLAHRKALSAAHLGKKQSKAHRLAISRADKGKHSGYTGTRRSAEHRANISKAQRGPNYYDKIVYRRRKPGVTDRELRMKSAFTKGRKCNADLYLEVTAGNYEDMLAEQGGGCAICGRPPKKNKGCTKEQRLHIDHCHAFGVIRGLLYM